MKVHIEIGTTEAKEVLASYVKTRHGIADATINITLDANPGEWTNMYNALTRIRTLLPGYRSHQKIEAIKMLREMSRNNSTGQIMGLAEAKYMIEMLA